MNESCPQCGLKFRREPGYFLGAMYLSYAMAVPLVGLISLGVHLLLPNWSLHAVLTAATLIFLPFVPPVFRYSRVFWLHFDRWVDPDP